MAEVRFYMNISCIMPALVTPYKTNGEVNLPEVKKLVRTLLEDGANGFYICGSTAECFMLKDDERKAVAEAVTEEVNGRVPVIAHVGTIWADQAADLAKHAASCGVTAVSSVPPFYYKFTFQEIVDYYKILSDSTDLPVVIYNFPAFSGVSINSQNIGEIIKNCRVGGLKYTDHNLFELEKIRRKFPELTIMYGHDEVLLNALPIGISGAIGSTFNAMTPKYKRVVDAYYAGNLEEASRLQHEASSIVELLAKVGIFRGVKYLLSKKGIECNGCRKPFRDLTAEEMQLLDQIGDLN